MQKQLDSMSTLANMLVTEAEKEFEAVRQDGEGASCLRRGTIVLILVR